MRIGNRSDNENGSVLVLVALLLPILLVVTAGGITGFSLYASHRELQTAADQAALAGAAALPPFDPNVLVENPPVPLPDTDPVYEIIESLELEDVPTIAPPLLRDLIPDPRTVACTIGSAGLAPDSAAVVAAFEQTKDKVVPSPSPDGDDPVNGAAEELNGEPADDPEDQPEDPVQDNPFCDDGRVRPVVERNPDAMTPFDCTNELILRVSEEVGELEIDEIMEVLSPIQDLVDSVVRMPLNHVLPAAFTPRMRVDVSARIQPPLLSFITGNDAGTMTATAVAYRRIKNAVVIPILPEQRLLIEEGFELEELGLEGTTVIDVMTNPVNLNRALQTPQSDLIEALEEADQRLSGLMSQYGVPCENLLENMRRDLRDIYDPPTGPAPSATDIVDAAIEAGETTAARMGQFAPDPDNPDSLAGEAFLLIGVTVDEFMRPVAATQIPILDAALVVMNKVSDGSVQCAEQTPSLPLPPLPIDPLEPLEPITEPLEPILEPITEPLDPVLDPITSPLPDPGSLLGAASAGGFTKLAQVSVPDTCYTAAVVSAANAHGAFRATLVE